MLDSIGITHVGKKHRVIWRVVKGESVFGLVHINATLECKVCGVRQKPQMFHRHDLKETGVHRLSYWLETDEVVGPEVAAPERGAAL